ncbi:hypothetical protein ACFYW6_07095 [Streptomyces sp. NPDC002659]|uniref:hypothetical protein n=1 Tax=Streptomyces sp. NPDC002659 TaxID=3364656 RepID=UPI0036CF18F2
MEPTEQPPEQPTPAAYAAVADLHRQGAAAYAAARNKLAEARNQLAEARIHGNEAAGA